MIWGGVNSPEVLILKARLQVLAAEYKAIKSQNFVAATAEKVVSDFKIALKVVQPFLDKILAIAKNKAGELSAEEANAAEPAFVAAPIFMANIAKIVIADSQKLVVSQLTKIAEAVGYVAESMGLMGANDEPLKITGEEQETAQIIKTNDNCDYYYTFFEKPDVGSNSAGALLVYNCLNALKIHPKLWLSEFDTTKTLFMAAKKYEGYSLHEMVNGYLQCNGYTDRPKGPFYVFTYEKCISSRPFEGGINCWAVSAYGDVSLLKSLTKRAIFLPIIESKLPIETVKFPINKNFDFFVTQILLIRDDIIIDGAYKFSKDTPPIKNLIHDELSQYQFYLNSANRPVNNIKLHHIRDKKTKEYFPGYFHNGKISESYHFNLLIRVCGKNYDGDKFVEVHEDFPLTLIGSQKIVSIPSIKNSFKFDNYTIDINFPYPSVVPEGSIPLQFFDLNNSGQRVYIWGSGKKTGTYNFSIYPDHTKTNINSPHKSISLKKTGISNSLLITLNPTVDFSSSYTRESILSKITVLKTALLSSMNTAMNKKIISLIKLQNANNTDVATNKAFLAVVLSVVNAAGTIIAAFPTTALAGGLIAGIAASLNILKDFTPDAKAVENTRLFEATLKAINVLEKAISALDNWNLDMEAENAALYFKAIGGKADIDAIEAFYKNHLANYKGVWNLPQLGKSLTKLTQK